MKALIRFCLLISVALAGAVISPASFAVKMIIRHVACGAGGVVIYTTNEALGDAKGYDLWMAANHPPPLSWTRAGKVDSVLRSVEVDKNGKPVSYAARYKCVRH